ncbi:MAG: hypothetical protein ACLSVX_00860 [Massilimicrobiota timonensis]
MVIEACDGNLYVNILDQIYLMQEIPEYMQYSKEFDEEVDQRRKRPSILRQ